MTVFNIPCYGGLNLKAAGRVIAEAVGVYHTLTIIHTDTDLFFAVLRLDYGAQYAAVHPSHEALRGWLYAFDDHPPPLLVRDAWTTAKGSGLDADRVCYDLICQVREALAQLGGVEA